MIAENSAIIIMTASTSQGTTSKLTLREDLSYSAALDNGYDADKNPNPVESNTVGINFYAICSWGDASKVAEPNLEDLKISFVSNKVVDEAYTITFDYVSGTPYYLKDSKVQDAAGNDSLTAIVAGGTYSFTQAVSTTEDRFEIVKKVIPAEPAICHQYGNLIITGHQGAKVKVLDMADQVAIAEQTLATDDEVISLSSLEKGAMYQVVMDEETMIIRIQ